MKKLIIAALVVGLLLVGGGIAQAQTLASNSTELTVTVPGIFSITVPASAALELPRTAYDGTYVLDKNCAFYCDTDVTLTIGIDTATLPSDAVDGAPCAFGFTITGNDNPWTDETPSVTMLAGDYPTGNWLQFKVTENGKLDVGDHIRICTVTMTSI